MEEFQYLARKIRADNWDRPDYVPRNDLRGVSLTNCLKTNNKDELSFWKCDNSRDSVAETVMAVCSKANSIEKVEVVLITFNDLDEIGCNYLSSQGDSLLPYLNSRHVDLTNLSVGRLKKLGWKIKRNLKNTSFYFTFSKKDVERLFVEAYTKEVIQFPKLDENLQNQLGKLLLKENVSVLESDLMILELNKDIQNSKSARKKFINNSLTSI